ncbi:MAG: hypothetical protein FGM27_08230 [Candidatus Omnitrophica bacterium]|nr:hypothetical protein [Candidatus Omnitrophota bacterium]
MDIEAFPEIENFQKLPRQVIVKAGSTSFDADKGASLRGIVINNSGHAIREVRVHVVILNEKGLPSVSTSQLADPEALAQGGIANFRFEFKEQNKAIADYHLYTQWRFDD